MSQHSAVTSSNDIDIVHEACIQSRVHILPRAGEDKKVMIWQTEDWKLAKQTKPLPKGSAHTVAYSPHGAAAFGDEPCLLLVCDSPRLPNTQAHTTCPHPSPSQGRTIKATAAFANSSRCLSNHTEDDVVV